MEYRIEKDTMGSINVPADKYWGAQTQRSVEHFKIGKDKMPVEIIDAFAILKKAASIANFKLGVLPENKMRLISAVCDEIIAGKLSNEFPLVIWQTGSGTQSNMNVNEVIANRAHVVNGGKLADLQTIIHPNDDVNKSQSSNDTFPTAMHIAVYKILHHQTIPAIKALIEMLQAKEKAYVDIVKIGRTHWMDATPLTLGQEFSGYSAQLEYGLEMLLQSLTPLSHLALGGTAVGTGINTPKGYSELVAQEIATLTNLPFVTAPNKFATLAGHEAMVSVSSALKTLSVSLMKIGNDIRVLASGPRCGIGEVTIPENEPGSSIMPGKVNPTQIEALTMVCAQVIGNDTAISIGAMSGHFELNVFKPMIAKNVIESANLLADVVNSFMKHCLVGLQPNQQAINQHLNNSLMLVTALNTHIGYDKAAEIAKKAHKENLTLKDSALQLKYVTEDDYNQWVDPKKMI